VSGDFVRELLKNEREKECMKIKLNVEAGARGSNHNQKIASVLKVKSGIKAGVVVVRGTINVRKPS
jgi:hypothetical protein